MNILMDYHKAFLSEKLSYDVDEVEDDLQNRFSISHALVKEVFDFFIEYVNNYPCYESSDTVSSDSDKKEFLKILSKYNIEKVENFENDFSDYSYEIFNHCTNFKNGGIEDLLKSYQAEHKAPRPYLNKLIPSIELESLPNVITIYRGMSEKEFTDDKIGQFWTLEIEIAKKFSNLEYNRTLNGIIVKAEITKEKVLHHTHKCKEAEIIIQRNSVKSQECEIINDELKNS